RHFSTHLKFSVVVYNESLYYIDNYLEYLHSMTHFLEERGVFIVSMFDSLVTRRIWKKLKDQYLLIEEELIHDPTSRVEWNICVLRPSSFTHSGSPIELIHAKS